MKEGGGPRCEKCPSLKKKLSLSFHLSIYLSIYLNRYFLFLSHLSRLSTIFLMYLSFSLNFYVYPLSISFSIRSLYLFLLSHSYALSRSRARSLSQLPSLSFYLSSPPSPLSSLSHFLLPSLSHLDILPFLVSSSLRSNSRLLYPPPSLSISPSFSGSLSLSIFPLLTILFIQFFKTLKE